MTTTLAQVRQYAAVELGGEGVGGFWSGTATGGTANVLTDSTWPVNTTLDVAEQWQDAWLLRPNAVSAADKLRIINQYTPTGGSLQPDLAWTNAPVAAEAYEIHTVLEPIVAMNRCINAALQQLMVEAGIAVTPIAGADRHSLVQAIPWLTNKSWVRQIGWLSTSEFSSKVDPYERVVRGEAMELGGGVVLVHPGQIFGASGQSPNPYTLMVRAMQPAYNGCMAASHSYGTVSAIATTGTTWTVTVTSTVGLQENQLVTLAGFTPSTYNVTLPIMAIPSSTTFILDSISQPAAVSVYGTATSTQSQSGLTLDSDIAPVRTEWLAWAAVVEAWRHYGQALDTQARQRLVPNRTEAADMTTYWTRVCEKWPRRTFRPLIAGGPLRISSGGLPMAYRATTA